MAYLADLDSNFMQMFGSFELPFPSSAFYRLQLQKRGSSKSIDKYKYVRLCPRFGGLPNSGCSFKKVKYYARSGSIELSFPSID